MSLAESNNNPFVNYGEVPDHEFLLSMERVLQPHWEDKYINLPDETVKLRVDPATGKPLWELYFENAVERQNIWWKRVMENQPAPWTDHPVMSQYHMTNTDRRDDRVTIFYIKNLLPHLKDNYESKKYLLLNTFIYRLFCRIETWEVIGYLHPETFEDDWARAKDNLRERREQEFPLFTAAYYVNDLKVANPDPATNKNKLENAICLIQWIKDHLDELCDFVFNPENNMESVVEYLTCIPGIGLFNSYEACLDLGIVEEYTGIPYVHFTPDHFPNVGPGCKRGIDYIFEEKGNMSYLDIVYFIASVYRHEFKRLGLDYKYNPNREQHLDLRVWEGWACESSKIFNYWAFENGYDFAKGKRPKKKMKLQTDDVNWLKE